MIMPGPSPLSSQQIKQLDLAKKVITWQGDDQVGITIVSPRSLTDFGTQGEREITIHVEITWTAPLIEGSLLVFLDDADASEKFSIDYTECTAAADVLVTQAGGPAAGTGRDEHFIGVVGNFLSSLFPVRTKQAAAHALFFVTYAQ